MSQQIVIVPVTFYDKLVIRGRFLNMLTEIYSHYVNVPVRKIVLKLRKGLAPQAGTFYVKGLIAVSRNLVFKIFQNRQ